MELFVRIRDANGKPVRERQPKVGEVVEWLREQGAIDYERAIYAFRTTPFSGSGAEYAENVVVAVVDAALRPPVSSSQENP